MTETRRGRDTCQDWGRPRLEMVALVTRLAILPGLFLSVEALAQGTTLNVSITTRDGRQLERIDPGATVEFEVRGMLSDTNNEGLARVLLDLSFTGGPMGPVAEPLQLPMLNFTRPAGATNSAGYGGTVVAGARLQVGGAQNTMNNTPDVAPFPLGTVITGVGHTEVVLAAGTVVAPAIDGDYRIRVDRVSAAVIVPGETGDPTWATKPISAGVVEDLMLSVPVCFPSTAPRPDAVGPKNRFVSFRAGDPGRRQAIRIVLADLPPPHDVLNELVMWVGEPRDISELRDVSDGTPPTFKGAELQCVPHFAEWAGLGTIHAFHAAVVPGGRYFLEVVDDACDANVPASFSNPQSIETSVWGDVVSRSSAGAWLPVDGVNSVWDIVAIGDKLSSLAGAPTKARTEMAPSVPDLAITAEDFVLPFGAFHGGVFPFSPVPPPLGCVFKAFDCGNGSVEPGEECDDGNTSPGDGCDAACQSELCGNGVVEVGEVCDDGNVVPGDGCSGTCTGEPRCGDGVLDFDEECDDGNKVSGDGCTAFCRLPGTAAVSVVPVGNHPDGSLDPGILLTANEIVLPSGGHRVFLEVRIAGWAASQPGRLLKAWQITIDASGYTSGLTGTLAPPVVPCGEDNDCAAVLGGACSFDGAACLRSADCAAVGAGERCVGPSCRILGNEPVGLCESVAIQRTRPGYVLRSGALGGHLDTRTPDVRLGDSVVGSGFVPDDGTAKYAASFYLDVPAGAVGTFEIGLTEKAVETFLIDEGNNTIPLAAIAPALITIGTPCCLPEGACHGVLPGSTCTDLGGRPVEACMGDGDSDGIADACTCSVPVAPDPAVLLNQAGSPVPASANRYLSFDILGSDEPEAISVTFVDMPQPFSSLNGQTMWVGEPRQVSELGGKNDATPPTFTAASLVCDAVFAEWSSLGTVNVVDELIIPGGIYDVRIVDLSCDINRIEDFSDPLRLPTSAWGDIGGPFRSAERAWTAPDGRVDVTFDVVAILDKFSNRPGALAKARADIEPGVPDLKVNITDVTRALDAFSGATFPFVTFVVPCEPGRLVEE